VRRGPNHRPPAGSISDRVLACLLSADASVVRATAAHRIARWLDDDSVADRSNALPAGLAASAGTLVAKAIVDGLRSEACRAAAGDWTGLLPNYVPNPA
jgi:hypothetical protein